MWHSQLFGGEFTPYAGFSPVPCPAIGCPDPALLDLPRTHFDYFVPAVLTSFTLMTDEWIAPLQLAVKVDYARYDPPNPAFDAT